MLVQPYGIGIGRSLGDEGQVSEVRSEMTLSCSLCLSFQLRERHLYFHPEDVLLFFSAPETMTDIMGAIWGNSAPEQD